MFEFHRDKGFLNVLAYTTKPFTVPGYDKDGKQAIAKKPACFKSLPEAKFTCQQLPRTNTK